MCRVLTADLPGSPLQIMPKGMSSKPFWILKNARTFFGRRTVQTYHRGSQRSWQSWHSAMRSYLKSGGFLRFEIHFFLDTHSQLLLKIYVILLFPEDTSLHELFYTISTEDFHLSRIISLYFLFIDSVQLRILDAKIFCSQTFVIRSLSHSVCCFCEKINSAI